MPLGGLQHYTIEPQDLERTKEFYCEVLGLENGYRPPLDFPGYWLYSGGVATVHLMGSRKSSVGIVVRSTAKTYEDSGLLEPFLFSTSTLAEGHVRVATRAVAYSNPRSWLRLTISSMKIAFCLSSRLVNSGSAASATLR